ncbi:MAG: biosynthetic-type acetolactate synthase large subunit [Christensenellales bacterium]
MRLTGAQIAIQCLLEQGVDIVFGYPGGQILPVYDALYEQRDKICHILPSHEQGATHAADGYARASGRVGVCIATSGPGATNLVTGIATANMDSVPMVVITGNVPLSQIGTDSFQEVDTTGITMPITKHNVLIRSAEEVAPAVRNAFKLAVEGRPGPVLLDLPRDVQNAVADYEFLRAIEISPLESELCFKNTVDYFEKANGAALNRAADMIRNAKRPMLLVGGGVVRSGASERLIHFARKLNIPVTCTLMGLGTFPCSDPLYLGNLGMHGNYAANTVSTICDLLIAVGTRFSDRISGSVNFFLPDAKVLHIDIDRSEIDKNVLTHCNVVGDASVVLSLLEKRLDPMPRTEWLAQVEELKKESAEKTNDCPADDVLTPKQMLKQLYEMVGDDVQVATDVGQHQMWVAQYFPFEKPGMLFTSGGMGTMGYGLGAAIGAQLGRPGKRTVLITGDGCFRMNCNELATLSYYNLPVVVIVMNNSVLGMVRQWQTLIYNKHYSQTTLDRGPDFVKLGAAYGIEACRVERLDQFASALQTALESKKPYILDCRIDKDEMVRPMIKPGQGLTSFLLE